ncbi:MqnA/MqnD/SBP family protein [Sulfurihydrogenibium sp.]|jgi:chorismate dehydratase|uniref:MqnA/MqnD/SBP family protein n=1 Tax=Sulfurihydrogenibium sp. TaxID=2053621 RepID=UPI0026270399|nr:MqnA/MqnD/SBP family protein [Sulfurihydrogenibium sp.]
MKIGWIDYLNTLPFQIEKFRDFQIVKDVPSNLNKLLFEGKIDVGIISAAEYLEHYYKYFILPDLSISSYKDVKSVILASHIPLEDIEKVYITKESKTSVNLLRVIFEIFLNKKPEYKPFESLKNKLSVLLIGDKALKHKSDYPYVYDLSKIWFDYTNLPFTFALWCVNKEYFLNNREEIYNFQRKLKENVKEFFEKIDNYPLETEKKEYLKNLSYDLTDKHIQSLRLFSQYLKQLNLIKKLPDFRFTDGKVITVDNTITLYNFDYNEAYHSSSAGAYTESMHKFIIPCKIQEICEKNSSINILDVGFGLGYNASTAIKSCLEKNPNAKIQIISIEKDKNFLENVKKIKIPENLKPVYEIFFKMVLDKLTIGNKTFDVYKYEDNNLKLSVVLADGRGVIQALTDENIKFDAVFWDPFSPKVNPEMWEFELFKNLRKIMKDEAIFATYSSAKEVKKNLLEAGFKIGMVEPVGRKSYSLVASISGNIPPLPEKEMEKLRKYQT